MPDDLPLPPKPRGRPPMDVKGTSVSAWVRPSEYDRLVKMANQRDTSVSKLVRSLLIGNLPTK